jgi:hypothetical protein
MRSDEQLIERIRGAMEAHVRDVAPPAELLVASLRLAPSAPARRAGGLRRLRVGAVVPVLAGLAAVAIAVVALTSFSHGRPAAGGPGRLGGPASLPFTAPPAGTPARAAGVVGRLAVLRRPQRAGDSPPRVLVRRMTGVYGRGVLVSRLTRLAQTVVAGRWLGGAPRTAIYVYVIVARPPSSRRADRVRPVLLAAEPGRALSVLPGPPDITSGVDPDPAGLGHDLVGTPAFVLSSAGVHAGVVPDGVTSVRWVYDGGTVHPSVRNNVAVYVSRRDLGHLHRATWYDARGRVVASFDDRAQLAAVSRRIVAKLARSGRRFVDPLLLRDFSVFGGTAHVSYADARSLVEQAPADVDSLVVGRSRFVPLGAGGSVHNGQPGVWVVPGERLVCLVGGGGTGCALASVAAAGGFAFRRIGSPRGLTTLLGLAPDGTRTVAVHFGDGTSYTLDVHQNVYGAAYQRPPVSVTLHTPGGPVTRVLP